MLPIAFRTETLGSIRVVAETFRHHQRITVVLP
jgi:hypothetical protein